MGGGPQPGNDQGPDLGDWRFLFKGSLTPMLIFDDERRILDANSAACALLESTRDELRTLRTDDLTPAENLGRLEDLFANFLETGSQAGPYTLERQDGERLAVEYAATANIVPGQHLAVLFLWRPMEGALEEGMAAGPVALDRSGDAAFRLSAREREILTLLALGEDAERIAVLLRISPATVRTHVQNARQKLGATTRAHAIALALSEGEITVAAPRPFLP